MADARSKAVWKGRRLYLGKRRSGYSVVEDGRWPNMWRVLLPDGSLSDMINLSRAKDAALAFLDRDLRAGVGPSEA